MRKKLTILLVIFITIGCIFLGINTRKINGIVMTQIATDSNKSLSYMFETSKNNIVMIDGGGYGDSIHLEEVLKSKGGVVEDWFITMADPNSFGAFQKILENGKIEIKHIYISFNPADWYDNHESEKYSEIANFLDLIYSENIITKVYDVPEEYELLVDNLYFSILNIKNPELNTNEDAVYNQSMVIKVNNTYKSVIITGKIANESARKFIDNNLDEIDCDAAQISDKINESMRNEIYEKMTPEFLIAPSDGENTYIIW